MTEAQSCQSQSYSKPSSTNSNSTSKSKKPTPQEIATLREARAAKKAQQQIETEKAKQQALNAAISNPHLDKDGNQLYQPRHWRKVKGCEDVEGGVRIVSWNMLAQGLVRRKLFPGSDCLKWKDREAGLSSELTGHQFDVGLFQEVDRIDSHSKTLKDNGYEYVFEKGYKAKQHGLMIAWRSQRSRNGICFQEKAVESKVIYLDDLKVQDENDDENENKTYISRVTRNIALFLVLKFKSKEEEGEKTKTKTKTKGGLILATTHLFWHPKHSYERVRQTGLIVQSLNEFRNQQGSIWKDYPVIFAGDFNDQPHSATYQLLTGKSLDQHALEEIKSSKVVHKSVDEKRESSAKNVDEEEEEVDDEEDEEEEEIDPEALGEDQDMLKNCRTAQDGELLSIERLSRLYNPNQSSNSISTSNSSLLSSYNSAYSNLSRSQTQSKEEFDNFFSSKLRGKERHDDEFHKEGQINQHSLNETTKDSKEPMWTLFSSLFSLTLDYIFLFPKNQDLVPRINGNDGGEGNGKGDEIKESYPRVLGLLETHPTNVLQPGVPRLGICASDHVLIGAEIEID